eukprot:TRINITY_DN46328_c0_g1_i1.p1 TRINITY_DN46328_c0_g1~~TRINITY_DN46328_c0_g1_i1.p1  ORF type:complete len:394 (+),score=62.52 TRINITY_DN46328_c0_g1_i1:57-1238(+)
MAIATTPLQAEQALPLPFARVASGRYALVTRIASGNFAHVYLGKDVADNGAGHVAIKIEDYTDCDVQLLEEEARYLKMLAIPLPPQGIPQLLFAGDEGPRNYCLVTELLGPCLATRLEQCGGRFTTATTVLIAEQALKRLEYVHSKCLLHRDIKPENFLCGVGIKQHHLYLIDFGLATTYFNAEGHVEKSSNSGVIGTRRYLSLNALRGYTQSRRDDLESLGYMLVQFLAGRLPWSGLVVKEGESRRKKLLEAKEQTKLTDLCSGLPTVFMSFIKYCRYLGFEELPLYDTWFRQFRRLRKAFPGLEDHGFQWLPAGHVPGGHLEAIVYGRWCQPDEPPPKCSIGPLSILQALFSASFCGAGALDARGTLCATDGELISSSQVEDSDGSSAEHA